WLKSKPIAGDQSRWGGVNELDGRNKQVAPGILEEAGEADASRDAITKQIGDYYAACIDEAGIEARGLAPFAAEADRIRALTDKAQLAEEIAHLHRVGVPALFEFGSGQDFKDSTAVVAQLDQGGL